jgi:hypothetical protein
MACADVPEPIAEAAAAHPQDEIDRAPVVAVESDPDLSPTGTPPTDTPPTDTPPTDTSPTGTSPTGTSPTGPSPTDTSPTLAEAGQEEESDMALTNEVREFIIEHMARRDPPWLIARALKAKFGLAVDREEIIVCWQDRDALPTQTGPRQEKESMPILNDEIKEFIVKRIACYETPSRIAAAVRINFGIDIDRRQVFEYNPAGSRPPAQRWIDLHAQTRARFLREVAEIGIAQKAIRLRMLDRFAQMAEDGNHHDKAAKFLEQAARECGGFYEKQPRMPAPTSRNAATESESSP